MEEVRKDLVVPADLSFGSLAHAIKTFKEAYDFLPSRLEMGVDNVFTGIDIREAKHEFALKNFWYYCNKDFPDDYWQVTGEKDSKRYIVYSEGA